MTKKSKFAVMPTRRFPEFIGRALREVQLNDVTSESTIRNGDRLPSTSVMGVTKAEGIVPMEERIIAADIARYKIVQRDWFAYNPMRLNIGSIARWQGEADILVSPDYVVFQCLDDPDSGIDPAYLDHFRQSVAWNAFVSEGGDGGVRVRVYFKDLASLRLVLPPRAEQQKIANCLTSLDKVISAQGRKVVALQTYKRGLMQQLFPCAGETIPRLRFPEFRDAPEWEERKLSASIDLVSGLHLSPNEYSTTGDVPYFTGPSDFTNDGTRVMKWTKASTNTAKERDTLITVKGSGVGECWYLEMPSVAMGRQLMAVRAKACSSRFIYQFLLTKRTRFEDLASGNLIPGLSRGDILDLVAPFPSEHEQQKIAGCLSSLDDRIAAESETLDALKTHKKGLMQQLFHSSEKV
ncbi:restriction endonuclease subunit S [Cupriavidus metallidurans]|uniref:restriction endonuclease subunit S n=1 Tax=Cupriavidus metallidurans TaxID=119219 RepID=UPI001BFC5FF3|nr:restriction endonuclease subunit S [Cupriavidus metallidurans]QWC87788.1 restriction endonuclease subunit S [Cupriavidus metallidurans]